MKVSANVVWVVQDGICGFGFYKSPPVLYNIIIIIYINTFRFYPVIGIHAILLNPVTTE